MPDELLDAFPVGRDGQKVWLPVDQLTIDEAETITTALGEFVDALKRELRRRGPQVARDAK